MRRGTQPMWKTVTHAGISTPQPQGISGTNFQLPMPVTFAKTLIQITLTFCISSEGETAETSAAEIQGDVTQWQKFWDRFNSFINVNPQLKKIDKFNHLHSLLEGQAARAMQGLLRSEATYDCAIDISHKRFGKLKNIISKHPYETLKISGCVNDDAAQLRLVYDKIGINVRCLES